MTFRHSLPILLMALVILSVSACTQGNQSESEQVVQLDSFETNTSATLETETQSLSLEERTLKWAKFAGIEDSAKIEGVRNALKGLAYDPKDFNPKIANVLLEADPNFAALAKPAAEVNLIVFKTLSQLFIKVPTTDQEKQEAEEQGIDASELQGLVAQAEKNIEKVLTAIAAFRFSQSYFANAMSYFYDLEFNFNQVDLPTVKNAFGAVVTAENSHAGLAYRYVAAVTFFVGTDTQQAYTFFDLDFKAKSTQEDVEAGQNPGDAAMGRFVVQPGAENQFVLSPGLPNEAKFEIQRKLIEEAGI